MSEEVVYFTREKIRRASSADSLVCEAHYEIPRLSSSGPCYTLDDSEDPVLLWQCENCLRWVCDGFGAADKFPNLCDDCWPSHVT